MKLNAAVLIPSGRPKLLKKTLKLFYKHWNNKFKYPIYIHTLGEVYSNIEKKYFLKKYDNLYFEIVNPKVPDHIKKKDLFYNRFYNTYVYDSFNIQRLGYLHSIYLGSNISSFGKVGCLSKKLAKYDYILRIDDDAWFRKKINFDMFKKVKNYPMATGKLTIDKRKKLQYTREKMFSFLKDYIKKNNIKVANKKLKKIFDSNDEKKLVLLPYSLGNFDLYNMKYFKSKNFKKFIRSINKFGGQYKYRWADYDITNLYVYIFSKKAIMDFNFPESIYKPSHPETFQINDKINFFSRLKYLIKKRTIYMIKKNNNAKN